MGELWSRLLFRSAYRLEGIENGGKPTLNLGTLDFCEGLSRPPQRNKTKANAVMGKKKKRRSGEGTDLVSQSQTTNLGGYEGPMSILQSGVSAKKRKTADTSCRLHQLTDAKRTGVVDTVEQAGRKRTGARIWNPDVRHPYPLSDLHVGRTPAAMFPGAEHARLVAMDKLRSKLEQLCRKHGLKAAPICAFDRWHFRSKEMEQNWEGGQQAGPNSKAKGSAEPLLRDPILPTTGWVDDGLVGDLERAFMPRDTAMLVSKELAMSSRLAAESIAKESSAAVKVVVTHRKHTIDVQIPSKSKILLKINQRHYDKLKALYRLGNYALVS